jgi:hypothetical protein
MAKRIVAVTTITPTATGDTTNLVDATYPFILQGCSATQRTNVLELYCGGQATSSAPAYMLLARDSQVGSGTNTNGTGQTDAAVDAATAALAAPVVTGNSNATNKPQRSSTLHLMNLSFNAFGGIVKWQAPQGWEPTIVGASASLGEVSFSAFTGSSASAAMGTHCIYETL